MAISALSGYGANDSYSALQGYQSWVDKANAQTEDLKNRLGIESESETSGTSKTSSTSSTSSASKTSGTSGTSGTKSSAASASAFLLNYKQSLKDLEAAAQKLDVGNSSSVFAAYERAQRDLSWAQTDSDKGKAQAAVDKAKENIVSAVKDFADKYNSTVSFLESNSSRSSVVAGQLSSLQHVLKTDKAMKTVGLGVDTTGKLQVDEDELNEVLDKSYDFTRDVMGGQFGIASRAGSKAASILDYSSIDSILGTSETGGSSSAGASGTAGSGSSSSTLSDDFMMFANFARSGAYNLSNFYAVGLLLNTLA